VIAWRAVVHFTAEVDDFHLCLRRNDDRTRQAGKAGGVNATLSSSWPGLTRPSTPSCASNQDVDARVKPGMTRGDDRVHVRSARRLPARRAKPMLSLNQNQKGPEKMPAPLDPVIAQIIPLLPLRDPKIMTPQSAREALRALAASRAAVAAAAGRECGRRKGKGRGRLSRRPRLSRFQ